MSFRSFASTFDYQIVHSPLACFTFFLICEKNFMSVVREFKTCLKTGSEDFRKKSIQSQGGQQSCLCCCWRVDHCPAWSSIPQQVYDQLCTS